MTKNKSLSPVVVVDQCLVDGTTSQEHEDAEWAKFVAETMAEEAAKAKEVAAKSKPLEVFNSDEDIDVTSFNDDVVVLPPGVTKRININALHSQFKTKVELLLLACEKRGVRYYLTSGLRSFDEQTALYAQGRTKPGPIVTWAKAGESLHNYGVAADFCRDKDTKREGLQPDWDLKAYEVLAEEAEKLGLEPGLRWKKVDAPHVQLRLARGGLDLAQLRKLRAAGGEPAVKHALDNCRW